MLMTSNFFFYSDYFCITRFTVPKSAPFVMFLPVSLQENVACLHQLYLFGTAMQLKRMGYHMTKMK